MVDPETKQKQCEVCGYRKKPHSLNLSRVVSFKVTPEDYERIEWAAAAARLSVSEKSRRLVLEGVSLPHPNMRQFEFMVMLEELVRLMLVGAQSGKKIASPEVIQAIQLEAVGNAPRLAAERLAALARLRPDLDQNSNCDAE